ncbi:unnamed protein product [Schistocephalus solidus]|uniref:SHR-BD domain-containing protein n=1 Tax=Schistocephalus solidus TaxID=70667 RepID=A0A183SLF9_SCHSO|nr:unnamed protein product [Schistocephalus solidus]
MEYGLNFQLGSFINSDLKQAFKELDYETDIDSPDLSHVPEDELFITLVHQNAEDRLKEISASIAKSLNRLHAHLAGMLEPLLVRGGEPISMNTSSCCCLDFSKVAVEDVSRIMPCHLKSNQSSIRVPTLTGYLAGKEEVIVKGKAALRTSPNLAVFTGACLAPRDADLELRLGQETVVTGSNLHTYAKDRLIQFPSTSQTLEIEFYSEGESLHLEELSEPVVLRIMRGEAVKSPSFNTGVPDVADPRLPEPLVAVDGSLVYQPFIMMVYEVSETDVSFHLELRPRDTSSRPQYLIVARHIYPPTLEVQNDGRGEVFWAVVPPNTSIYGRQLVSFLSCPTGSSISLDAEVDTAVTFTQKCLC